MTSFDPTLAAALREEAQEIAMDTEINHGRDVLEDRLDDVDRSRRRTAVVGAAAAAVVIGGAVWLWSGTTTQPAPPTTQPTASASVDAYLAEGLPQHWTTWISPAAARLALQGTPFEADVDEIFAGLAEYHGASVDEPLQGPWQFDMYIDGRQANVYVRDAEGQAVRIDQFDYELIGGTQIAADTVFDTDSVESAVYDATLLGTSLRLRWVSGSSTGGAPADANEGPKRVLYTSTTWTASDGGGPSPSS